MTRYREPKRYLVVGGACAVANNLVLIASDQAGLHYGLSILLCFVLVTPFSYFLHAWWTFDVPRSWIGFVRFVIGQLSGLLMASITIIVLKAGIGLPMIVTAPLATVIMMLYNFFVARFALRYGQTSRQAPS